MNMPQGRHIAGKKMSKAAMSEFGPGKHDYIFCPNGEAVYYKKSWHHASDFFLRMPEAAQDKGVSFKLCPSHEMEKNKQFEGQVVIKNIPAQVREELVRLIEHMGEHAMRRDVLDRVLGMRWAKDQLTVTTSENQLAQKIGRKIKETFKKHIAEHISRPKGGDSDVVSVQIAFTPHLSPKPRGLATGSSKSVLSTGFNTPWKGAGFIKKQK